MDELDRLLEESLQRIGDDYREDMEDRRAVNRGRLLAERPRFNWFQIGSVALAGAAIIAALLVVPGLFDDVSRNDSVAGQPPHPAIAAMIDIPSPRDLAAKDESVWVSSDDGTLTKIDAATNSPTRTIDLGGTAGDVGVGGSRILVAVPGLGELVVLDAETFEIVERIDLAGPVDALRLSVGTDAAWVVVPGEQVFRIDLGSMEPTALDLGGSPVDVAARGEGVWLLDAETGLNTLDPVTGAPLGSPTNVDTDETGDLYADQGSLWIARGSDDTITRISQATGVLTGDFGVPGNYIDMAINDQAVWMLSGSPTKGFLIPLDLETGDPLSDGIEINGDPLEVRTRAGVIWVAVNEAGRVLRIDPDLAINP